MLAEVMIPLLRAHLANVRCAVIAVSGGMDSVALAALTAQFRNELRPDLTLYLAHVNHGLRGEASEGDARFCAELAHALDLPFRTTTVDVTGEAVQTRRGIEASARALRYAFLENTCRELGASHLMLAHHADDQAETVALHLLRGAGAVGAAGMQIASHVHPVRFRPFLATPRALLADYCLTHQLVWREDASNRDTRLRRNWIRHVFLPKLAADHDAFPESLRRLGMAARRLWTWREPILRATLEACRMKDDHPAALSVSHLRALPSSTARDALWLHFRDTTGVAFSEATLVRALRFLENTSSGKTLELPGGWRWTRTFDTLTLTQASDNQRFDTNDHGVTIPCAGSFAQACGKWFVEGHIEQDADYGYPPAGSEGLCADCDGTKLAFPLVLRPIRTGDRFQPLGAPGEKRLSDFLREQRVPHDERSHVVVLEDARGIVWVLGHRIAHRVRCDANTEWRLCFSAEKRGISADSSPGIS